jgi:hypothetical protein
MLPKPLVAFGIARILGVLPTVKLDDKPVLAADEINDKSADRLLAHEFAAIDTARA